MKYSYDTIKSWSKSVPRQTIAPRPEEGNSSMDESTGFKIGTVRNDISVSM